jgi:hypothetical protein
MKISLKATNMHYYLFFAYPSRTFLSHKDKATMDLNELVNPNVTFSKATLENEFPNVLMHRSIPTNRPTQVDSDDVCTLRVRASTIE